MVPKTKCALSSYLALTATTFMSMTLVVMLLCMQPALAHQCAPPVTSLSTLSRCTSSTVTVIEHLVFFNMERLLEKRGNENSILQGLNDLVYKNESHLYFLYSGRVVESKGVAFTHALMSRFPSIDTLKEYYDHAIRDIAAEMRPWLMEEFCVDYAVEMEKDEIVLNITNEFASHVTFIKASSNASDSDLEAAMDAFLRLALETDYTIQMTTGENLYMRERYRTMSHAFTAYFSSVDAMEKWQMDSAVVSVLQHTILALADTYAQVVVVPYAGLPASAVHHHDVQ